MSTRTCSGRRMTVPLYSWSWSDSLIENQKKKKKKQMQLGENHMTLQTEMYPLPTIVEWPKPLNPKEAG